MNETTNMNNDYSSYMRKILDIDEISNDTNYFLISELLGKDKNEIILFFLNIIMKLENNHKNDLKNLIMKNDNKLEEIKQEITTLRNIIEKFEKAKKRTISIPKSWLVIDSED